MNEEEHFGIEKPEQKELFFLDYGGPNVAKPLHVGHMRTAIVGESIKRIIEYKGHNTISDVHLGDFSDNYESIEKSNLGKIIAELKKIGNESDDLNLTEEDYRLLDEIREIRNYWCHQCYLDYIYIQDAQERETKFQEIAEKLHFDEPRTWKLSQKIEKIRLYIVKMNDKKKAHR